MSAIRVKHIKRSRLPNQNYNPMVQIYYSKPISYIYTHYIHTSFIISPLSSPLLPPFLPPSFHPHIQKYIHTHLYVYTHIFILTYLSIFYKSTCGMIFSVIKRISAIKQLWRSKCQAKYLRCPFSSN